MSDKNINSNFALNAIVRRYGSENGTVFQVMGKTIIPFEWYNEYSVILNCKPGSFLYIINVTKNTTSYLNEVDSNGGLCGLSASTGDVVVFFGMVEDQ